MNTKLVKLSSVLVLGAYLAACGDAGDETTEEETEIVEETEESEGHDQEEEAHEEGDHDHEEDEGEAHDHDSESDEAPEAVSLEGIEDHYHTGELIELQAILEEEVDYSDWHWYSREEGEEEWEMVEGQGTEEFLGEAPEESFEIRAVLYDDSHEAYAQSPAEEIVVDNH